MPAFYIFDNNEQRGPFEAQQIAAMWKQGLLTANAQYYDERTQEWRSAAEIASPIATALRRAVKDARRPPTPEEKKRQDRIVRNVMLCIGIPAAAFVVFMLYAVFTYIPSASHTSVSEPASAEYNMGYIDGLAAGHADRRSNSVKMGYGTRQNAATRHSAPLPPEMNRRDYERGWTAGYEAGYESHTK